MFSPRVEEGKQVAETDDSQFRGRGNAFETLRNMSVQISESKLDTL